MRITLVLKLGFVFNNLLNTLLSSGIPLVLDHYRNMFHRMVHVLYRILCYSLKVKLPCIHSQSVTNASGACRGYSDLLNISKQLFFHRYLLYLWTRSSKDAIRLTIESTLIGSIEEGDSNLENSLELQRRIFNKIGLVPKDKGTLESNQELINNL